jgi:peptidoglycan/LPS O-acetylase OafA/YrhL
VPAHPSSSEAVTIVPATLSTTPRSDAVEGVEPFLAVEGWGLAVLVGAVAIWPLMALLVAVVRRRPWQAAWRTFAWAALAAGAFALLAVGYAVYLVQSNGTSRAMASLGPQIAAGLALLGAVASGLVAIVLRVAAARSGTEQGGPVEGRREDGARRERPSRGRG